MAGSQYYVQMTACVSLSHDELRPEASLVEITG
jgi:hypothetical protein